MEPLGATKGEGEVEPRFGTAEGESAVEAEHSENEVLKVPPPAGSVLNQTVLAVVNT